MKVNIAIFGSCCSEDIFRSHYNNYKLYYNKNYAQQRSSMISLMSPKLLYNQKNDLFIEGDKHCIENFLKDFNSSLFDNLDSIDYLIIDVFNDARWGVIESKINGELTYITNTKGYIERTNFYKKNIEKLKIINFYTDPELYFHLWKESFDKFFEFIKTNYPSLKIVLNSVRCGSVILLKDGTYSFNETFSNQSKQLNIFIKKMEEYILENYLIDVIHFPKNFVLDENHIWGSYIVHYVPDYYHYAFNQFKIIVLQNILVKLSANVESLKDCSMLLKEELKD